MELFLFFSSLLHQFRLEPACGGPPSAEPAHSAMILVPPTFSARIVQRDCPWTR